MAEVMNSLFGITPESLMARRDQELQAQAMQYAKMDPFQRATSQIYMGANRLGGAVGGLLGAQDPEMMRLQQRQGMMQGLDLTNPESLKQGIEAAMRNNDYALVGELTDRYEAANKNALNTRVQESVITKNTAERNAAATPAEIQKANTIAATKRAIRSLEAGEKTPETLESLQVYKDQLAALEATGTKTTQSELGKLLAERSTLDPIKDKASYDAYTAKIKKLTTGGGIGSEIAAGLGPIMGAIAKGQAQKSGEAAGADAGKQAAAIEGKYTALNSVEDALDVVSKGIYAGGYGPLQEGLAKYSMGTLADKQRLVNTEEFRSYIGNVVIPRLTEFGGNDSVEELKYLKSVMAGETTMESKSIEKILGKVKKNIERGITRIQDQQKAIAKGEQLPTGPTGGSQSKQYTTKSGVKYTKEN